jgi:molybdenum cofactor biosynthesis enzyme MoaA
VPIIIKKRLREVERVVTMRRTLDEITVEVIQKCNSNCVFCSSLSTPNSINEISLNKNHA